MMREMKLWIGCFAMMVVSVMQQGADAGTLYGANGSLYQIDQTTGASTLIDSGNFDYRLGLAFNSPSQTMYSMTRGRLSTLDVTTGNTTLVGTNSYSSTGLTFSGDFSTLFTLSSNGGSLLHLDPTDGSVISSGSASGFLLDLATSGSGLVYGVGGSGSNGGIHLVDTTTGGTTKIGTSSTRFTAVAIDENDIGFGIEIATDALYQIDLTSGAETLVGGDIGFDIRGMAFVTESSMVPEPTSLAIFGLGVLGLAGGAIRRRR